MCIRDRDNMFNFMDEIKGFVKGQNFSTADILDKNPRQTFLQIPLFVRKNPDSILGNYILPPGYKFVSDPHMVTDLFHIINNNVRVSSEESYNEVIVNCPKDPKFKEEYQKSYKVYCGPTPAMVNNHTYISYQRNVNPLPILENLLRGLLISRAMALVAKVDEEANSFFEDLDRKLQNGKITEAYILRYDVKYNTQKGFTEIEIRDSKGFDQTGNVSYVPAGNLKLLSSFKIGEKDKRQIFSTLELSLIRTSKGKYEDVTVNLKIHAPGVQDWGSVSIKMMPLSDNYVILESSPDIFSGDYFKKGDALGSFIGRDKKAKCGNPLLLTVMYSNVDFSKINAFTVTIVATNPITKKSFSMILEGNINELQHQKPAIQLDTPTPKYDYKPKIGYLQRAYYLPDHMNLSRLIPMGYLVGAEILKNVIRPMYQGFIKILGDPTIKKWDKIIINDLKVGMSGIATVRKVIHVFSPEEGFYTLIQPMVIASSRSYEQLSLIHI